MAKLGDYVNIRTGYAFKSELFVENAVPIIRIGNLTTQGMTIDSNICFNEEFWHKNPTYRVYKDDILVAMSGATVGKCCINSSDGKFLLNQRVAAITVEDVHLRRYIYHLLNSEFFKNYVIKNSEGCAQPNISTKQLSEFTINISDNFNIIEIVTILDKIDELIGNRKKQLSKLDELVKSRFIELFGDTGKQVPLTDYVWFQEGPGVRSIDFTDDGTILLTGSNINDNTISFGHKSDRHISNELASGKYAHFMCDKDDILVVSSAIDPDKFDKKVVVVDADKKYCLNTGIIRFKPNKQYLTLGYFREFLKTDYFKHQVSSEMRGIAQMHFGPSHLKQMTILLPDSIERQIEFESFVQQTDKSKLAIQKSLEQLETLKKSLMQQYFG